MHFSTCFSLASLQGVCSRAASIIQVLVKHTAGIAAFPFISLILRQDQGEETVKILQFLIKKLCKYMKRAAT